MVSYELWGAYNKFRFDLCSLLFAAVFYMEYSLYRALLQRGPRVLNSNFKSEPVKWNGPCFCRANGLFMLYI